MYKHQNNRRLEDLSNLGATIIKKLKAAGIHSEIDLRKVGPGKAYRLMQKREVKRLPVCYYLYSLAGALKDMNWIELPENEKFKLRKTAGLAK